MASLSTTNALTVQCPEVKCPTCQSTVLWNNDSPHRPFCSQRCQLVDFGEWANENHRIDTGDSVFERPDEFESNGFRNSDKTL